jgi:signal transduction histidine kinase
MKIVLSHLVPGLRLRLLMVVMIACVPLIALVLHNGREARRRQISSWRQRSQRIEQIAGHEEEELIGSTRQLLFAVAESSAVRNNNRRGCKQLLQDLLASYPRYANLGVLKSDGELLASAAPLAEPVTTNSLFFRRAFDAQAFAIGDPPSGQSSCVSNTIGMGYPVFNRTGQVQSVVFAALDLRSLRGPASELSAQVPKLASWTEHSESGVILARYPSPEHWVGRPYTNESLARAAYTRGTSIVDTVDDHGISWVYALGSRPSRLAGGQVSSLLAIPQSVLFAQADRALWRNLGWCGSAVCLALLLGWLGTGFVVLGPLKALVRSSTLLAKGDLSARTGLAHRRDELGQVTRAFDQMAQALEDRENERKQTGQQLQALSHRLVEVQETERRQIARELHDEIGQSLTVAGLSLQAALQCPDTPALQRRLKESIGAVERVMEQVHDLSLNLRPSMLDDLGLEPALRWYTHRQAALTGLQADFHAEAFENRMDPIIETECFRVAQEALTNVVRHAQAQAVSVELSRKNEHLHLSVRDDGVGFDVTALRERAVHGASLGLLSMEERAALAGGGLEYRSGPGLGTEVHAWFPLRFRPQDLSPNADE